MLNTLKIILLLAVLLTVESAFPGHWPRPDAVLLVLVPWALRFGRGKGAAVGFAGGMLLGIVSGAVMGIVAVAYGITGYLLGWWGEREVPCFFVELMGTVFSVSAVDVVLTGAARLSPWQVAPSALVLHEWMLPVLLLNCFLIWPADSLLRIYLGKASMMKLSWRL